MPFDTSVQEKPTALCIGSLASFGPLKEPKEGKTYYYAPTEIRGAHGSLDAKGMLLYVPSFFAAGFKKSEIERTYGKDAARSRLFVYESHIAQPRERTAKAHKVSTLQALCGSPERFEELAGLLDQNLGESPTAQDVYSMLKGFLEADRPEFGYVLRQERRKEKVDDGDGNEVTITTKGERYEIDGYFWVTQEALEAKLKGAEKRYEQRQKALEQGKEPPEEIVVSFDPEVYGLEMPAFQSEPGWVAA